MDVEKLDLLMHMTLVQYALWLSCISTFETYEKKGYLVECKALDLCLRLTCILADGQKKICLQFIAFRVWQYINVNANRQWQKFQNSKKKNNK